MSYEIDFEKSYICPCGKGAVVEASSSNEWNQVNESVKLKCTDCEKRYHIEYISAIHGDHEERIPVLVPTGDTIYRRQNSTSFPAKLCISYPLKILEHVFEVLTNSTTYSNITDETTREVVRKCKSYHDTMRIKTVREYTFDAIKIYNKIINNYDMENERINDVKKKIIYIHSLKAAN